MSRFLFVVPPLAGHTFPTVAVGQELAVRGHTVAWAGNPRYLDPLLPAGTALIPVGTDIHHERGVQPHRAHGLRGAAALKFLWEDYLIPLAHVMVPGTAAAAEEFRPDVMIVDQQALAGALVARQRRLPWVTSATTSAELTDQFATMPRLGEWVRRCIEEFQLQAGVPDPVDLRFSDDLLLAFTSQDLVGASTTFPGHYVFVGPAISPRPGAGSFSWDWLDPARRHVLVSLGTVNSMAGQRFFTTTLQALEPLAEQLQAIVVAPPGLLDAIPDHVLVREFVPQLDLLPHLDAVISHAGHNTVCETLAHGLPLVLAPIRDDQPVIAGQVAAAGAGIRVHFGRVGPTELRAALTTVLDDPTYRVAARGIQASFTAAGGAPAAADHLEKLL